MKKILGLLGVALMMVQVADAAIITWNNADTGGQSWSTGGNWVGGAAPVSGTDSAVISDIEVVTDKDFITLDVDFTIASGQSITADGDANATLRPNHVDGQALTVATGGTLDLATGAGVGTYGGTFNASYLVIESGATVKVDVLDYDRAGKTKEITFKASDTSAVTLFEADDISLADASLILDLSAAITTVGTYELFDYDTLAGTFGVTVSGLGAGETFSIDYAYDLGGGDMGIAVTVIPEPATIGMLGLGAVVTFLIRKKKQD
jgi:hypothetical protein